jgi:hypothetical protein
LADPSDNYADWRSKYKRDEDQFDVQRRVEG